MKKKLQGLFDKMVAGVLAQNGVAFDDSTKACSYLTTLSSGEVCRCAVGQLFNPGTIDDEKYRNMSIGSVQYESPTMWNALKDSLGYDETEMHGIMQFLINMQQGHDRAILKVIGLVGGMCYTMTEFDTHQTESFKGFFIEEMISVADRYFLEYKRND